MRLLFLLLALLPLCVSAQVTDGLNLRIADIAKGFDAYGMVFESGESARTTAKADTQKALAFMEIIGVDGSIKSTTLMIAPVNDNNLNLGNTACTLIFLSNIFPEWKDRNKWTSTAINKVANAKNQRKANQQIIVGDKRLNVSFLPEPTPLIFLTVQPKDKQ